MGFAFAGLAERKGVLCKRVGLFVFIVRAIPQGLIGKKVEYVCDQAQ